MTKKSEGRKFKDALASEHPLHVIGVADGSDALAAEKAGFKAIYLSGSQIAASRGWADIGRLELKHVVEAVVRIKDSGTTLPLLVDVDTGFEDAAETIKALEAAGAAAVHMEDQEDLKACGHLDGKQVVSLKDATNRIKRAVSAKTDPDFVVMARTDALAAERDRLSDQQSKPKDDPDILSEAMSLTLERIKSYSNAGADMIFAEAFPDPATYKQVKDAAGGKPVLANMTEFGKVDLMTPAELDSASSGNVDIVLNPLSVYRAQRQTAENGYDEIRKLGTQRQMVVRGELQERGPFKKLIDYDGQVRARMSELSDQTPKKKILKP
jgi:methylisocitrate lyase